MKRYFTATALSCLLISSTFTISKPVYANPILSPPVIEAAKQIGKKLILKAIVKGVPYIIEVITHDEKIWTISSILKDGQWIVDSSLFLFDKDINLSVNDEYVWQIKQKDTLIGKGMEAELVKLGDKTEAGVLCRPSLTTTAVSSITGAAASAGAAAGAGALGGYIGATIATTSCLASIGLTAASFGATTLLSIGVCSTAIAAGTATGVAVGGTIGGVLGGILGKYSAQELLISYFDEANCIKKELTVKTPNDQAPTYKCEVWCDACIIIKHSRNHFIYASKSQDAEIKAKNEYITYFTENKTTSDIMARHNKHDHLKATCERIAGTKQ
jgi:hypothetical protein